MRYIMYNAAGRIVRTIECSASMIEIQKQENEYILETDVEVYGESYWVQDGKVKEKTALPFTINKLEIFADGEDSVIIHGLPAGIEIDWPDFYRHTTKENETVEFLVDLLGKHTFSLFSIPYLFTEITIEAIAAT